jgi:aminoglycoside 6'-N-acetyltransferase
MAPPPPDLRLTGPRLVLRPGTRHDAEALHAIRSQPDVVRWWRSPDPVDVIAAELAGGGDETVLVIEVGGAVAGAIQYFEETEPDYRHAAIDIYLAAEHQRQGLGPEAIRVLATYLVDTLGHHRLTIDPAVDNAAAIRAYERVGFRPVGVMRRYERGADGSWHDALLMDLLADELRR